MKIAVISDTHFGYPRFEEDSYNQAEEAFKDAGNKADMIIYAGDVFDTKIPKLETIERAAKILRNVPIPVYAIHGNHERRSRDMVNPAKLLAAMGLFNYINSEDAVFEKDGEKVQIFGLGNVPEEYAKEALENAMKGFKPIEACFRVLVLHQSIKELIPGATNEISLEELDKLPFDLIVNGHIHVGTTRLGGKFIIPGSTVITQLKKDETTPRGYVLYDSKTRSNEFIPIKCRAFFYAELDFSSASAQEIKNQVEEAVGKFRKKDPDAIIRIRITGNIKDGLTSSDLSFEYSERVFIDNNLECNGMKDTIDRIRKLREDRLTIREMALKELIEKTKGRVTAFDPAELFDKLVQGTDDALKYLKIG